MFARHRIKGLSRDSDRFGKSKIGKDDVAGLGEEDVLGLKVSVNVA